MPPVCSGHGGLPLDGRRPIPGVATRRCFPVGVVATLTLSVAAGIRCPVGVSHPYSGRNFRLTDGAVHGLLVR